MSEKRLPPAEPLKERTGAIERRPLTRRDFVKIAAAVAGTTTVGGALSKEASAAGPKPSLSAPTLTCVSATQASITVRVCAGATGGPAGFSLQWQTLADYNTYGWGNPELCGAGFSGAPPTSRYKLAPNECVDVVVGDFLLDQGASTTCPGELACGTEYVFRAFAHANSDWNRSNFSSANVCATLDCGGGCTYTQGYWKSHNPGVCQIDPTSPLCVGWPVDSLTLGDTSYAFSELLNILNQAVAVNGLVSLAHQLIATKLNVANGADSSDIASTIAAADALMTGLVVPPVGSGYLAPSTTSALTTALMSYNEGATGPGHCA